MFSRKVNDVLNEMIKEGQWSTWSLEQTAEYILDQVMKVCESRHGYVSCFDWIEKNQWRCIAVRNMSPYVTMNMLFPWQEQKTLDLPLHLTRDLHYFTFTYEQKSIGYMAIHIPSATCQSESWQSDLSPLIPQLCGLILGASWDRMQITSGNDLFFSNISHELRTPLNGIMGMTRLLRESQPQTDEQKNYLNVITECGTQLIDLVEDVLDYAKLGCGRLKLDYQTLNPIVCIHEVAEILSFRLHEKNLDWEVVIDPQVPTQVLGDKKRLRQILLNIVNNSIKFTDQGSIVLRVYIKPLPNPNPLRESIRNQIPIPHVPIRPITSPSSATTFLKSDTLKLAHDEPEINWSQGEPVMFHFEIEDTGVGIEPELIPHLFQSFRHAGPGRNPDGVGLGLAICKKLTQLMQGDIEIKFTQPNKGTCIHFYLPFMSSPDSTTLATKQKSKKANRSIVWLEPNMEQRLIILQSLPKLGSDVPMVLSSWEEVLTFLKTQSFSTFVLLLVPVTPNSWPATLKRSQRPANVHIWGVQTDIMTTSTPITPITPECDQVYSWTELLAHWSTLISNSSQTCEFSFAHYTPPPCLLVVEDNYHNTLVIQELLKKLGVPVSQIHLAVNGVEAVQKCSVKNYDLIFMDLKLPLMDGYEATRQILNLARTKCPPKYKSQVDKWEHLKPSIVALTACVLDVDQDKCKQLGMKGFLSKPVDKDALEVMLEIILQRRKQSQSLVRSVC